MSDHRLSSSANFSAEEPEEGELVMQALPQSLASQPIPMFEVVAVDEIPSRLLTPIRGEDLIASRPSSMNLATRNTRNVEVLAVADFPSRPTPSHLILDHADVDDLEAEMEIRAALFQAEMQALKAKLALLKISQRRQASTNSVDLLKGVSCASPSEFENGFEPIKSELDEVSIYKTIQTDMNIPVENVLVGMTRTSTTTARVSTRSNARSEVPPLVTAPVNSVEEKASAGLPTEVAGGSSLSRQAWPYSFSNGDTMINEDELVLGNRLETSEKKVRATLPLPRSAGGRLPVQNPPDGGDDGGDEGGSDGPDGNDGNSSINSDAGSANLIQQSPIPPMVAAIPIQGSQTTVFAAPVVTPQLSLPLSTGKIRLWKAQCEKLFSYHQSVSNTTVALKPGHWLDVPIILLIREQLPKLLPKGDSKFAAFKVTYSDDYVLAMSLADLVDALFHICNPSLDEAANIFKRFDLILQKFTDDLQHPGVLQKLLTAWSTQCLEEWEEIPSDVSSKGHILSQLNHMLISEVKFRGPPARVNELHALWEEYELEFPSEKVKFNMTALLTLLRTLCAAELELMTWDNFGNNPGYCESSWIQSCRVTSANIASYRCVWNVSKVARASQT